MITTDSELERFNRDGFLIFPDLVKATEIETLRGDLRRLAQNGQGAQLDSSGPKRIVTSEANGTLRTMYEFHATEGPRSSPPFCALARAPRLLGRAREILGTDELYMFQSKANLKSAIDGAIFQWHQDYAHWILDGVPKSTLVTFLVMLEEATELSGCLYFIPGSHKLGLIEPEPTPAGTPRVRVPKQRMLEILRESPTPVPIVGKPGTGVVFHSDIVHASGHNLSGNDRWHIYFVYNPIANKPREVEHPRPSWAVSRNYDRLEIVPDDGVLHPPVLV